MAKLFFFFFLSIYSNIFSQIKIDWNLDKEIETAYITIKNEGLDYVVIPINRFSLQAYFSENCLISETDFNKSYPYFSPTLIVNENLNQKKIETFSSTPSLNLSEFNNVKSKNDSLNVVYTNKIDEWKRIYKIKNTSYAKVNYYLMNNLLTLKPNEKIKFSIPFNLKNITNQENSIYDSYILEQNKKYSAYLSLCVEKDIYKYLTNKQKRSLKRYVYFSGKIESNKIMLNQN